MPQRPAARGLAALSAEVSACRRCPRLVAWREQVAVERRAAYREEPYWGRPVPGFGDARARLLVVGLAPAAHGANRTGRMFTGDRSGDWLYAALHRAGFASQPTATSRDDGLRLRDAYVTAPVRCAPPANRPTTAERDACAPFLARELALLDRVRVIVALGGFATQAVARHAGLRPRPRFAHGGEWRLPGGGAAAGGAGAGGGAAGGGGGPVLLGCYHPSQQNTFTGRLTAEMLDAVFARARALLDA